MPLGVALEVLRPSLVVRGAVATAQAADNDAAEAEGLPVAGIEQVREHLRLGLGVEPDAVLVVALDEHRAPRGLAALGPPGCRRFSGTISSSRRGRPHHQLSPEKGVFGKRAGGGGSYLNGAWVYFNEITIAPNTNSPIDGYVVFQLTNDAPEITTIQFTYNTNKCIDDYGSGISNGNNIQTYSCTGNANQLWYFKTEDRTVHSMVNYNKCLDLSNGTTSNGANIQLWDCVGGNANQHWVYNGLYKTIHSGKNSDKCLDANGGSQYPNSNVNVQLWDCNYLNNNQKWNIDGAATVADVTFKKHIVPVLATSSAVHSHTGAVSGSNIQLWTKDDSNEYEQWFFEGLAIKMRNHRELCIDLSSSNTDNGNNIQLYNCNGSNAQKWLYDGMTKSIRSVVNPDKCMQIEYNTDGAYGKRSNVNIYDCNGSDVQQFLIQK